MAKLPWYLKAVKAKEKGKAFHIKINPWWIFLQRVKIIIKMAAKGIEKVSVRFCVQDCVYWGNPVDDGYGGFIFDAPVEIKCRWEDKQEVMLYTTGKEFTTNASVLLTQDVDNEGYMWLGTLAELQAIPDVDITKPISIKQAYIIRRFDKIPMVKKTDEFTRTAYLFYYGK